MEWKNAIDRARRGFRDDRRLYLVAISSLSVAFLCLGGALLMVANLGAVAERWSQSGRITVYLEDEVRPQDVAQMRMALDGLAEVRQVEEVTPAEARAQLLAEFDSDDALRNLPANLLPGSLEITLASGTSRQRTAAIATRVAQFRGVDSVDTYRSFFDKLERLLTSGRTVAVSIALLVALCVVAVVGNTIRLSVARRHREIEVLKLCGATDVFVRRPLVVEGTMQAFIAAFISLVVLALGFAALRSQIDGTLAALIGVHCVFLSPLTLVALLAFGAGMGALGSFLSVRRYLSV